MRIPTRLWEFIVTSLVIILAPGPSVLFIIARAIAWGRVTALFSVLGNALGAFLLSALVALGLGPLLQRSAIAYGAVQWGGGVYLVYLGAQAISQRQVQAQAMSQDKGTHPTSMKSIRDGFMIGVLNPKTLVFFAAVLPQFIDRQQGQVAAQLLFLGALFVGMALISDGSWALIAGSARNWLARDKVRLIALRTLGGAVMIILGGVVIIAAIRHAFF